MFKRKIYTQLLNWKNKQSHKPLIIKGLRQIGKTTIVTKFAKDNYQSVITLDFRKDLSLHQIFDGDFDIDEIIFALSLKYKTAKFVPYKTVLIFDELQDCPNARSSLKYFALDGRYDIICTGSLLGIKNYRVTNKQSRGIPVGFEEMIEMKPMDFEEFLWANSVNQEIIDTLYRSILGNTKINDFIHERMLDLFNKYICIGGMPEVVDTYIKTNNFNEVKKVQKRILMSFESDFGTHLNDNYEIVSDENARAKILSTFYSIPNQLAKDNQKFQYSTISKNAKARDYKSSVEWLENYGLISRCYNLTLPEIPFEFFKIEDSFKVFLNDTGLYIAMLEDNIPDLIINGKLKIAKGAIYENIVAETFSKLGRKLYYYRKDSGLEIDFITEFNRQPVLVEVKAKNGHTKSAKEILENKVKYKIDTLIKLTANNISGNQTVLNFPYYLTLFLFKSAD